MLTNISANNIESRICIGDHEFHISEKKHAPACSLVFHDSQTGANKKISLGIVLPHIPNVKGVDVQAVHNELSVFDISGFSRPQIAVLLALIEASKDEFKCEGAQQGLYTLLARDLVDFARKDIEAQGNSALIGSVVSAAAGAACGAITAFHEIKASTLNIKASELNQRSSNLNLLADGQDKA
ncbi:hypothetical protein, partial [Methanosarcina mazei]|uniref:hypothetical protein n=1 Tax=Methanosarcina mazei TaxID=2209 RepID=UPI0012D40F15